MTNKCVLCGRDGEEEHHLIPRGLVNMLDVKVNPDLYRIYLCHSCHVKVSNDFKKIESKLRKLQQTHDDWFQEQFDDNGWSIINQLRLGHTFVHDVDCKECNKPMEKLWINQLIQNGVDEGKRNLSRFKLVANLKRLKYPDEEIKKLVLQFNTRCRPPEQERIVLREIDYHLKRFKGGTL